MVVEEPRKKNTQYLNMPDDAQPMEQRRPNMNTALLTEQQWVIQVRIDEKTVTVPLREVIIVGRILEAGDNIDNIGLDLSPHGGYQFGVSRRHAVMTLHKGHLYIEDLGSTNGTRINGFQLTPKQKYRLRDSDEIEFARLRTSIRFKKV